MLTVSNDYGIYLYSEKNPRAKKVLIREYNRFELISIRLDEGRFISPDTDSAKHYGQITWTDFYRKMMDDMRESHARDMERLTKTITETYELQIKQLKGSPEDKEKAALLPCNE